MDAEDQAIADKAESDCRKKTAISQTDFAIAHFLIEEYYLMVEPVDMWGNINDDAVVEQILKISSKQSYDKINQFLWCFVSSCEGANYNKTWKPNQDIIQTLLKEVLSGFSGTFDVSLRSKINNHFKKLGVPVSINMV